MKFTKYCGHLAHGIIIAGIVKDAINVGMVQSMLNNTMITDKTLWRAQGIFAIITLRGAYICYAFFMFLYISGFKQLAIQDLIIRGFYGIFFRQEILALDILWIPLITQQRYPEY